MIFIIIAYKDKKEGDIKIANHMVILFVIVNIFIISAYLYFPLGHGYVNEFIENGTTEEKYSSVNGRIKNFKEAIDYIKSNDNDFYRISLKNEINYANISIIYDYNPIEVALSLGNGYIYNLSSSLEDNKYSNTMCIIGADRRTKFTTLISNKYYICDRKDLRYIPYGYTLYHEIGDTLIYLNENFIPVGIIYDSYITQEQFDRLTPIEREDSLITTAIIEDNKDINVQNVENIKIGKTTNLVYNIEDDDKIVDNTIYIDEWNEKIELKINDIPLNSELYLSINNLNYISNTNSTDFKITANIDGITNNERVEDRISSPYYINNSDFLINLGVTKKNQDNKLILEFNKKGIYSFENLEILAVSMEEYEEKIDKLKTNIMENIEYGNDYIKGTVNSNRSGILQITTSYSDGWKAYVDGKEVDVFKVNKAFIGINIEEGQHNVEFKYETPYLRVGGILSVIGVLAYIATIVIEKRKNSI